MKLIIATLIAALTLVTTVSAATGSTSTGSTTVEKTCFTGLSCPGGPTRGFNVTTNQYEMVPQCFPWAWLLDYYAGNILAIYTNEQACKRQRSIDFGI